MASELTYLFPHLCNYIGQCRLSSSHLYVDITFSRSPLAIILPSHSQRHAFLRKLRHGLVGASQSLPRNSSNADMQSSYTRSGPATALPTPIPPSQAQSAKVPQKTKTQYGHDGPAQAAAPPGRSASRASKAKTPKPPTIDTSDGSGAPAYRRVEPHTGPPHETIASPDKSPRAVIGDLRPQVYHPHPQAHEVPLPQPRSVAPTVYTGYSPARTARTLRSEYADSPDVAAPPPRQAQGGRSRANTNATNLNMNRPRQSFYAPTPPNPYGGHHQGSAQDGVAVIDFAQHALQRPLPDSRPTTVFSAAPRRAPSASVTVRCLSLDNLVRYS